MRVLKKLHVAEEGKKHQPKISHFGFQYLQTANRIFHAVRGKRSIARRRGTAPSLLEPVELRSAEAGLVVAPNYHEPAQVAHNVGGADQDGDNEDELESEEEEGRDGDILGGRGAAEGDDDGDGKDARDKGAGHVGQAVLFLCDGVVAGVFC